MASSGEEKDDGQDDTVVYDSEIVLDLCGRRLKRLEKAPANQAYATALVLDNNSLQNLANLDSYGELERLSIANNQIVRMYWFARMYSLRVLNLPNNNIVQVEGMRELIHLVHLNLAGNKLKTIEGLSYNRTLEHLNLSGNFISHVNDLSMLKNLKELFLHRNLITTLYRCNKYLPPSLIILTLSDNGLNDLNDLSNLSHLNHLEQVTILNNPCLDPIQPTDESGVPFGPPLAFDYRPYVINWCLNLKVLDGYKVTPKESLKAEWLYSQGKGRGFQVGEHAALVQYLSGVCLAGGGWGGADLPDDDDKLAKILQLAKQHQHDLRHSVNGQDVSESSSGRGSRSSSHHDSPAMHRRSVVRSTSVRRNTAPSRSAPARECHRRTHSHSAVTRNESGSRSQQANSYHVELSNTLYGGDLRTPDTPSLMTQSMDPAILSQLAGTAPRGSTDLMSRSLGAEQLSRSLGVDPMTQSMGEEELKYSMEFDPMTQSQGPEQLARSLAHQDSSNSLMTRSLDLGHLTNGEAEAWGEHVSHPLPHSHPRPTSLFGDENDLVVEDVEHQDHSSQLTGSSKFVPAPESIMSPEFQAAVATHTTHIHSSSGAPTQQSANVARSSSLSRSQRPPPSIRSTSASQGSPRQPTSRSSSVTRPRASPLKSPVPTDIARGSPSRTARPATTLQNTNTGPSTLPRPKPSPKPAPRYVRSVSVEPTTSRRSNSAKKKVASPHHGYSDADSDNTDSEMSVSKLQTIKSIAAERKQTEKRGRDPVHSSHAYDPEKYRNGAPVRSSDNMDVRRRSSNSSSGSSTSDLTKAQAAITLQKHWRGYQTRNNDPNAAKIRDDIRHSRAEQHIKHLTEKLRSTEEALERERRLRHMQLDAIRTLWREIQKLQASKRDGVNTPSTPITPLTPLTPLDSKEGAASAPAGTKKYSEESVKELTEFCASLQGQVGQLQESLSMVTQVMNAFCNLPGSQSLLTMSQSSGSGHERSPGGGDSPPSQSVASIPVPLSESVTSLTHSIRALTTSIVKSPSNHNDNTICVEGIVGVGGSNVNNSGKIHCDDDSCGDPSSDGSDGTPVACQKQPPHLDQFINPEMINSMTSVASTDLNATALDASTLSVDSTEGGEADTTGRDEAELSESSQSSLSGSLSGSHSGNQSEGGRQAASQGPQRPSSLPVPRPHTPRTTTS
ncbi:serine-rich adhesin for platelets isoform X3 [Cherax quadricarinatus]|uniref:serine-rich adhesin for platelets isoform X3 n=1 Tax=Cherax quadricarinatus TaxID=27406 RepID=UPI002378615C|nr:mucin-5AC-like isoform X1 [Cherax quadricarinatus]